MDFISDNRASAPSTTFSIKRGKPCGIAKNSGYKVIRIPFEKGKPEGGYENFLTGWVPDEAGPEVWGRPVGLLMIKDGSLLVVDDGGKKSGA